MLSMRYMEKPLRRHGRNYFSHTNSMKPQFNFALCFITESPSQAHSLTQRTTPVPSKNNKLKSEPDFIEIVLYVYGVCVCHKLEP